MTWLWQIPQQPSPVYLETIAYPRRRARVSTRLCRLHILLPISIQCDSIPPATTSFLLFVLSSHSLSDFPTASHARAELPVRLAPIFHRSTHARLSWQPLLQENLPQARPWPNSPSSPKSCSNFLKSHSDLIRTIVSRMSIRSHTTSVLRNSPHPLQARLDFMLCPIF